MNRGQYTKLKWDPNSENLAEEIFPPRSIACRGQAGRYDLYCTLQ